MPVTKANVVKRAAEELGIIPVGQSLQSQHNTRITQGYTEVYRQLEEEELATWASDGNVPDKIAKHVISLVAENCLETYPVSNDRYQRILLAAEKARRQIPYFIRNEHNEDSDGVDY